MNTTTFTSTWELNLSEPLQGSSSPVNIKSAPRIHSFFEGNADWKNQKFWKRCICV